MIDQLQIKRLHAQVIYSANSSNRDMIWMDYELVYSSPFLLIYQDTIYLHYRIYRRGARFYPSCYDILVKLALIVPSALPIISAT